MQTKFSRKELERLNCSEEEINLILAYQKKLPILVDNNSIKGFSVNARILWEQLECPQGQFTKWVNRKFEPYGFKENIDFSPSSQISLNGSASGIKETIEFFLTIDMAKQLAMVDKKESGFLARKYFILMEDIVARNKEWIAVRDPEKEEYKKMSEEINNWCFRLWHRKAYRSDYAVEADMLNTIVTGKTSQQLKSEYGAASNDLIRDYLKKEHNEELLFLEQQNQVLLLMNMGFTERKNMLTKMHEVKFKSTEKVVAA